MWPIRAPYSHLGDNRETDLPVSRAYMLKPAKPAAGRPFTSASPLMSLDRRHTGAGIFNLLSIAYAFRPRLRVRLTLRRLTLLRKPEIYGDNVFHIVYRYLCQHLLFRPLQYGSRHAFRRRSGDPPRIRRRNALLPRILADASIASVTRLVPEIIGA